MENNKVTDLHSLNEFMEEKEEQISELKETIEQQQRFIESDIRLWNLGQFIPMDDFRRTLPVPRLEMMLNDLGDNLGCEWIYGLVREAHEGMRSSFGKKEYNFTPFSRTTTTSRQMTWPNTGEIIKPYRDPSHIMHDGSSLGLRVFLTCPSLETIDELKVNDDGSIFSKRIRNQPSDED